MLLMFQYKVKMIFAATTSFGDDTLVSDSIGFVFPSDFVV